MSFQTHEQTDFLLELIRRLGETLRALVTNVTRSDDADELDEEALADADAELERAMTREFGAVHGLIARVTPRSAVGMLRPRSRLRAYATLLGYRALLAARRRGLTRETTSGDAPREARESTRALSLLLEIYAEERALPSEPATPVDPELIRAVSRVTDCAGLEPRYRALLDALDASS